MFQRQKLAGGIACAQAGFEANELRYNQNFIGNTNSSDFGKFERIFQSSNRIASVGDFRDCQAFLQNCEKTGLVTDQRVLRLREIMDARLKEYAAIFDRSLKYLREAPINLPCDTTLLTPIEAKDLHHFACNLSVLIKSGIINVMPDEILSSTMGKNNGVSKEETGPILVVHQNVPSRRIGPPLRSLSAQLGSLADEQENKANGSTLGKRIRSDDYESNPNQHQNPTKCQRVPLTRQLSYPPPSISPLKSGMLGTVTQALTLDRQTIATSTKPFEREIKTEKFGFAFGRVYSDSGEMSFEELRMNESKYSHHRNLKPYQHHPSHNNSLNGIASNNIHSQVKEYIECDLSSTESLTQCDLSKKSLTKPSPKATPSNMVRPPTLHTLPEGTFPPKPASPPKHTEKTNQLQTPTTSTKKLVRIGVPLKRDSESESDSELIIIEDKDIPDPRKSPSDHIIHQPDLRASSPSVHSASKCEEVHLVSIFSNGEQLAMNERARKWLESPQGRAAGFLRKDKDVPQITKKSLEGTALLEIAGQMYQNFKGIGSGGFANVYTATRLLDGSSMAIKVQKPSCQWEFYISNTILSRVPKNMAKCFIRARQIECYPAGSIMVMDQGSLGTLQDVINLHLSKDAGIEEQVVLAYAIEIIQIVSTLHSSSIIHADIKPDNFLIRRSGNVSKDADIFGVLEAKGLQLIDYGQSIDLSMYPPNVQFTGRVATDHFCCVEMQQKRPWKFQTDYYTIAGTIHSMLFGKYMEVTESKGVRQIKQRLKRYWNRELWEMVFRSLLNPHTASGDVLLDLLQALIPYTLETPNKVDEIAKSIGRIELGLVDYLRRKKPKGK